VQLIAEKEILIAVATLVVHCCAILRRTFLLHHSYTMLPMCSSQYSERRSPPFIQKYNLGNSVPDIAIMLRIFLTIPVSVATCESFSKLKLIKNYLRSSMST